MKRKREEARGRESGAIKRKRRGREGKGKREERGQGAKKDERCNWKTREKGRAGEGGGGGGRAGVSGREREGQERTAKRSARGRCMTNRVSFLDCKAAQQTDRQMIM